MKTRMAPLDHLHAVGLRRHERSIRRRHEDQDDGRDSSGESREGVNGNNVKVNDDGNSYDYDYDHEYDEVEEDYGSGFQSSSPNLEGSSSSTFQDPRKTSAHIKGNSNGGANVIPNVSKTSSPPPGATTTVTIISTQSATTPSSTAVPTLSLTPTTGTTVPIMTYLFSAPPDATPQPRKGLNSEGHISAAITAASSSTTSIASTYIAESVTIATTMVIAQTALGAVATDSPSPLDGHPLKGSHPGLSETTEHLLIAAGAIGAFIIVVSAIWIMSRWPNNKLNALSRDREFRRGGDRNLYGWRRNSMGPPPVYMTRDPSNHGSIYNSSRDEKQGMDQTRSGIAASATPVTQAAAAVLSSARQKLVGGTAAYDRNGTPRSTMQPITQRGFLPTPEQNTHSIANSEADLGSNTYDSNEGRVAIPDYNNTYKTDTSFLTNNTSNLYHPTQQENNHMSFLSSLSSGFGDQIISPDGLPQPVSRADPTKKFSWVSSLPGPRRYDNRDTIMTTNSVDTAPRFRTVNSWVAQQSGRVERGQFDEEIPAMPEIPAPLRSGPEHHRSASDNPEFNYHPGQELEFERGSRVASSILDSKTGTN